MNMRSQVNHPDAKNYMGNMVLIENTDFPYELIQKGPTEDVLSTLAPKIRRIASESHVEYYAQEGYLLDNRPDKYLYDMFFDPEYDDCLELSNHSRFAHYEVDFGSGIPELVRNAPDACNILAYIMPANPKVGGYNIELKLAPDVAAYVVQNTSWMKLVDTYEVNRQL
ncbi:hypothetical protein H4217_004005 [Coemansia sp. RSA 1939]|nr:hypothetical protein H4217_004005 [Coemansia sp. RSA 1939]